MCEASTRKEKIDMKKIIAMIAVLALAFRPMILNTVFGEIEAEVMANAMTYFALSALSYLFLGL